MATGVTGTGAIDVNSIVTQLMTIEQRPLVALQKREAQVQSQLSAYGRVQGALASVQSALDKLRLKGTFSAAQATVSGEGASAAVSGAPAQGRYSISITQLARAQSSVSSAFAAATTSAGIGSLTLKDKDGAVLGAVAFGGAGEPASVSELKDAINALPAGVRASLVNDANGTRLVLTSADTGAAHAFTTELAGGAAELAALTGAAVQTAQDAQFSVNGVAVTSASNVVQGVVDGLTLNLTRAPAAGAAPGTTVDAEVIVAQDTAAVRTAVADFVKAYNDFNKLYTDLTKYDPGTKTAAVLNGDSSLRSIQSGLRSLVLGLKSSGAGEPVRLSEVGVEFQRDGTLKLDETKFNAALAADPDKVTRLFTDKSATVAEQGFAVRVGDYVLGLTQTGGLLAARQDGVSATIRSLDQQQDNWTSRLALIEQRLRQTYSKLDALLASRDSQSAALTNALAGLPTLSNR